jgi:5-dehydro-2-deoxygluconokinase
VEFDLICVGRCSVDLYAEQTGVPLRHARSLSMYVGGCCANVAVGASRLGLRVAMLTRVGADETGEFLVQTLQNEGVDTSWVGTDPEAKTPVNIASIQPPDRFHVTYYRERAADLRPTSADLPTRGTFLVAGSTMSVPHGADLVHTLVHRPDCRVILDVDYRPSFWAEPAGPVLDSVVPFVDLLVGTEEELGLLTQAAPCSITKHGPRGATLSNAQGEIFSAGFPVEVLNTLGAGDAFLAGFLAAWLRELPLEECLRRANANGALVVTRHGCAPAMPRLQEVLEFLALR